MNPVTSSAGSPVAPLPVSALGDANFVATELVPPALVPTELAAPPAAIPPPLDAVLVAEKKPAPVFFPLRVWNVIWSAYEWVFGVVSLLVGLAILGSIPIVSFLALGYLLDVSGRIARSGRLRDGFSGVRAAYRLGTIALGCWLVLWPLRLLSDVWHSAQLIEPASAQSRLLGFLLLGLTLLALVHVSWACFRGGRLRHFFWPAPIRFVRRALRGGMYQEARDRFCDWFASLRLWYFFRLGLIGFFGAVAWLVVPVLILVGAAQINHPVGILPGLLGFFLLALVLLYLPFLQTHFAVEGRFRAMFELGKVRLLFRYAPLAYWFALFASLLFTFPVFLTQIAEIPPELRWLPNLICVAGIFPARLLSGWTMGRARKAIFPRFFVTRWLAWFGIFPVSVVYVFFIYFTQFVCYTGWKNLIGQNTMLIPVPLLGL